MVAVGVGPLVRGVEEVGHYEQEGVGDLDAPLPLGQEAVVYWTQVHSYWEWVLFQVWHFELEEGAGDWNDQEVGVGHLWVLW